MQKNYVKTPLGQALNLLLPIFLIKARVTLFHQYYDRTEILSTIVNLNIKGLQSKSQNANFTIK